MEKFIHEKTFDVRYRDVDFQDELKPSAAFSFMEEIASYSAEQIGWGVSFLKPRNYAFILSGVVCEFVQPMVFRYLVLLSLLVLFTVIFCSSIVAVSFGCHNHILLALLLLACCL